MCTTECGAAPPRAAGLDTLTLRWLSCTSFEIAYRGQVVLLDGYRGRGPRNRPIGFTVDPILARHGTLSGAILDALGAAIGTEPLDRAPVCLDVRGRKR